MQITSHQLARELLDIEDRPMSISIDISTCDSDSGRRTFSTEYNGINDINSSELVLLYEGELND